MKNKYSMNRLYTLTAEHYTKKPLYTHLLGLTYDESYHKHSFVEFFYAVAGECKHKINDQIEKISIGDAYLLLPDEKHGFYRESSDNFLHRDIVVNEDYFKLTCDSISSGLYEKLKDKKYPKKYKLSQEQILDLENNISCLTDDFNNSDNFEMFANLLIYKIVSFPLITFHSAASSTPAWIKQIVSILSAPHNFRIPLSDLLEHYDFNRAYICRTFKKATGMPITDYFNKERLQYARMLIQTTNDSISQICDIVGFNNISHFYRAYGKIFSESPASSRKKIKANKNT